MANLWMCMQNQQLVHWHNRFLTSLNVENARMTMSRFRCRCSCTCEWRPMLPLTYHHPRTISHSWPHYYFADVWFVVPQIVDPNSNSPEFSVLDQCWCLRPGLDASDHCLCAHLNASEYCGHLLLISTPITQAKYIVIDNKLILPCLTLVNVPQQRRLMNWQIEPDQFSSWQNNVSR